VESALKGQSIVWGAPTFDQVRIGWGEMRHGVGTAAKFTQQRMTAEFPTGGRVIFRSLDDPDNARGHTADGVVIDEAQKCKPESWYEVLRPMLIDTGGWAWGLFTPMGRNWVWHETQMALDRDDTMAWQIPTLGCEIVDDGQRLIRKPHPLENPDIPFSEIEQMFQTVSLRTFRQEVLAQFLEGSGVVFRNIAACLYPGGDTPEMHEGHEIVIGVDWGKSEDYTVASVGCRQCKREVELDRFHGIPYRLQRARLQALAEKWSAFDILAESNSMGEPNIEDMQFAGMPVRGFATTASSKPPLIESLVLAFEREEVQFIADPVGTSELEAFEMTITANNRPRYQAPEGLHDDTVIGRALMNDALQLRGNWMFL
jgi:hypothetical protein